MKYRAPYGADKDSSMEMSKENGYLLHFSQTPNFSNIFSINSRKSQNAMKENPMKRPRVPPNSATKDSKLYRRDSFSTTRFGDIFHKTKPKSP